MRVEQMFSFYNNCRFEWRSSYDPLISELTLKIQTIIKQDSDFSGTILSIQDFSEPCM